MTFVVQNIENSREILFLKALKMSLNCHEIAYILMALLKALRSESRFDLRNISKAVYRTALLKIHFSRKCFSFCEQHGCLVNKPFNRWSSNNSFCD